MPSHLYPRLNGHQKIYPCQVPGCFRARNNSTEKKNVRWFHTKDAMVKHMNRKHNLGIQNESTILCNIGLSQEANKKRHLSSTKFLESSNSNEMHRAFPCQVLGCTRARNEIKDKTHILWFSSKMEMTRHLNAKHEVGVRRLKGVRKTLSSYNFSGIKYHELGRTNCETTDIKEQVKLITTKSETTSAFLPPLSPKRMECNINIQGNGFDIDEHLQTKTAPYLPPLSPKADSFNSALDFKGVENSDRLKRVNASISINKNSLLSKYCYGHEDAFEKDVCSSGNSWDLSQKRCSVLRGQTDDIKMNLQFTYTCAFCDFQELIKESINKHIWDIHFEWVNDRKMINCPHCPHQEEKLEDLAWHVNVCHLLNRKFPEKGYFFSCLGCNKTSNDVNSLKQHKEKCECKLMRFGYRHSEIRSYEVTKNPINHAEKNTCFLQKSTNFRMHPTQNKCIQKANATQEEAGNRQKKIVRFLSERKHPSSYAFAFKTKKKFGIEKQKLKRIPQTFWEKYC